MAIFSAAMAESVCGSTSNRSTATALMPKRVEHSRARRWANTSPVPDWLPQSTTKSLSCSLSKRYEG